MDHWKLLVVFALHIVLANSHSSGTMTTAGGHCVFPFRYKGVTYRSCTTKNHHRPWCSTTANYDREKMWGNCAGFSSSGVKTNSNGYCVFPFRYKGVTYRSCTTKNHNRPWCSTTANYDKDNKWGNCAGFTHSGTKTTSGQHCVFPFIYRGVTYRSCTTKYHDRPWCSTTANYDKDTKWGNCAGFYSGGVKTTSGQYCAFPFIYKGHHYNVCTWKNHNRPWCSTTTNYHKDKKWGNCFGTSRKTTSGRSCVFPFIYRGVKYWSCTTKYHNRPWCSTTANYDQDKKWGNCV